MFLSTLSFFSYNVLNKYFLEQKESKSVEYFFNKIKDTNVAEEELTEEVLIEDLINYIGVLEIPKINLVRGLVDMNSSSNNVDSNVEILSQSTMPNTEHSNLYLASHSGNSSVSFFKKIDHLIYEDEVNIYYGNIKYIYKVTKLYEIDKTGFAEIKRSTSKKTLYLITCIDGTEKQLIIVCELEEERKEI